MQNADFDSFRGIAACIDIDIAWPYVSESFESLFLFSLFQGFLVSAVVMAEIVTP